MAAPSTRNIVPRLPAVAATPTSFPFKSLAGATLSKI